MQTTLPGRLRIGSDLTPLEKQEIIEAMFNASSDRSAVRERLIDQYRVSEGTISSLVAHETMRRQKIIGKASGELRDQTQHRTDQLTDISRLDEATRSALYAELKNILDEHEDMTSAYDLHLELNALADYYDMDMPTLEQFVRNRLPYLGKLLDAVEKKDAGNVIPDTEKTFIRRYVSEGGNPMEKKLRRQEMVQKYSALGYHVNGYVIGAITAWKETAIGNLKLGGDGTPQTDGPLDIQPIPYAPMPVEPEEPSPVECRMDAELVRELATEYDFSADGQRGEFLKYVFDCYPEGTIEDIKMLIPNFPDDEAHQNPRRTGEGM